MSPAVAAMLAVTTVAGEARCEWKYGKQSGHKMDAGKISGPDPPRMRGRPHLYFPYDKRSPLMLVFPPSPASVIARKLDVEMLIILKRRRTDVGALTSSEM